MQSSNWSRGLFGTVDQNMRVSDAERQAVADRLAVHYADGRLDQAEFDERAGRAMSAKTRADLDGLLDDLPEPRGTLGAGPSSGAPGIPAFSADGAMTPRHRHNHPLIALAIIAVIILSVGHVVWIAVSWLWIAIIAVIVLAATGHLGHHHHHHHGPQRVEDDI
jgi:uncharacterized membrane protein YccC